MEFARPLLVLLALLALPLLAAGVFRRGESVPVAALGGLSGVRPSLRLRLSRLLPLPRAAAFVLIAVAAAGPRIGHAKIGRAHV